MRPNAEANARINAEIYNYGPALLEEVRQAVMCHATVSTSVANQQINQKKLVGKVADVTSQAVVNLDLSHEDLWQMLWQRVVYAGTKSAKATKEIKSMPMVPLFQSLDYYEEGLFVFDEAEWQEFQQYHGKKSSNDTSWLKRAKASSAWNPASHFKSTTPGIWKILTKDDVAYPGLQFSAWPHKVKKYINIARALNKHRQAGHESALQYYTEGRVFGTEYQTGTKWLEERKDLAKVRTKFVKEVGMLTAMHVMMDLGFRLIKPDRVMTYLFSQLGWLQTLPSAFTKEQVTNLYLQNEVVEEVWQRADVLAYRLHELGQAQPHRWLDIWMVKYGQDPEPEWGITVNLQDKWCNIRGLLDKVKNTSIPDQPIDTSKANSMWPGEGFTAQTILEKSTKKKRAICS